MEETKERAMERLKEVCEEDIEMFLSENDSFTEQARKCVEAFNELKSSLTQNQKELLFKLEEETARKNLLELSLSLEYYCLHRTP